MSDTLSRIDAVLENLCPCGAQPREGSGYCGYDCEPSHISTHTDVRETGEFATPMRWRPDLVSAADDSGLRLLEGERNGYTGRRNATVYERTPDVWHLRLDDGHRFVGCDIDVTTFTNPTGENILDLAFVGRMRDAWERLERELGNSRHTEPDPWAGVINAYLEATHSALAAMDSYVLGESAYAIVSSDEYARRVHEELGVPQRPVVNWRQWVVAQPVLPSTAVFRMTGMGS